jgi:putative flavoprotein involved in K+ transport
MARDGVVLVGRLRALDGQTAHSESDLAANLAAADDFANGLRAGIDKLVAGQGIDAPPPDPADDYVGTDGFSLPSRETILWSAGYEHDFSWVRPARLDEWGYPVQRADLAGARGLYFLGMNFLHTRKSGLLYGVGDDAAAIAQHIARRGRSPAPGI